MTLFQDSSEADTSWYWRTVITWGQKPLF